MADDGEDLEHVSCAPKMPRTVLMCEHDVVSTFTECLEQSYGKNFL